MTTTAPTATRPVQNASNAPGKLVHLTTAPSSQEYHVKALCAPDRQHGFELYPADGSEVTCAKCQRKAAAL